MTSDVTFILIAVPRRVIWDITSCVSVNFHSSNAMLSTLHGALHTHHTTYQSYPPFNQV